MKVCIHRSLRDNLVYFRGGAFKVDAAGHLDPQPEGAVRARVLAHPSFAEIEVPDPPAPKPKPKAAPKPKAKPKAAPKKRTRKKKEG